jgi:hypothetical protein
MPAIPWQTSSRTLELVNSARPPSWSLLCSDNAPSPAARTMLIASFRCDVHVCRYGNRPARQHELNQRDILSGAQTCPVGRTLQRNHKAVTSSDHAFTTSVFLPFLRSIMVKHPSSKVPVSVRALLARANYRLAAKSQQVKVARGAQMAELGRYYLIDKSRNAVLRDHIGVEDLAREYLREWETLVAD